MPDLCNCACMGDLQGLLDTPGGEERVVLKRVKARVQVRTQQSLVDPQLTPLLEAACTQHNPGSCHADLLSCAGMRAGLSCRVLRRWLRWSTS